MPNNRPITRENIMSRVYKIYDWANNLLFNGMEFNSFDDAWGHIYMTFPDEENFDDYFVY